MNLRQKEMLQLLRRVHEFLVDAKLEGPLSPEAPQVKAVAQLADRLKIHGVTQDESVRQRKAAVSTRRQLQERLRTAHLIPVARQGRVLFSAQLSDPALAAALNVPEQTTDPVALVASARALANTLEPYADRFTAVGFPSDFLTQLRSAADRVETSAGERRGAMRELSGATAAAVEDTRQGAKLVRVLDPLVRNALRNDAERLAAWKSVRRTKRRPQAKAQTPTDGEGEATPPVATTPAAGNPNPEVPMPKAA